MSTKLAKKKLLATTFLASLAGPLLLGSAMAQAAPEVETDDTVQVIEEAEDDESVQERVTVTGSRIQRSEFTSIKPIQVISGDISRDIGLVDAASLLQESTAATGLQIDTTFNGFVLDNGPGASTIDLRGLGASRSLVLINGRRLGAAGVEGAPGVPDLNLIPSSLIDRIDVLLDGASSIYGSDAVAGVANVILRKDFDGLEVEGSFTTPERGGGGNQFAAASWGTSNDRGFMGFGAEWSKQQNLKLNDRPDAFGECATPYEQTTTGEIRTADIQSFSNFGQGLTQQPCNLAFGINRVWIDPLPEEFGHFGSLYYTPGTTNTGIPNYSETSVFGVDQVDANGNLAVDFLSPFYQQNGYAQQRQADVQARVETFSAFTYGEYDLGFENNTSAFFEALYSNRQFTQQQNGSVSFRISTPATNPFNVCNPNGIRGVDCGQALDDTVLANFGGTLGQFGLPSPVLGGRELRQEARLNLRPEDAISTADVSQFRIVGGLKGDLPIESLGLENWTWEASASYDRATGQSRQTRLSDDRLALSIATSVVDPNTGNVVCGFDADGDGIPDSGAPFAGGGFNNVPNCVPVDVFSPTLYGIGGGDLATDAEYDYLISNRTFNTIVEQTVFQAVATGDLFEAPGGTAAGVIGVEYREDTLDSQPDDVARLGLNVGFFSDRGASGSRDLLEGFGEIEVPLVSGKPLAEEITVNLSGRWTEESAFGSAWTYAIGAAYRPTDYLTLRGSFGTSFRAPNLQEQFIQGQSGFLNVADPCTVSDLTYVADPNNPLVEVYDPTRETRDPLVLDNCRSQGVDPTTLGRTGTPGSAEVFTFKGLTLQEETSEAATIGLVFEQPFFNKFDLTTSITYYDIEVEDTIISQSAAGVVNDCYIDQPSAESALCGLVRRSPATGYITEVDTPFINQDAETARGLDFGVLYQQEFTVGTQELDLGLDIDLNHTLERTSVTRAPGSDAVSTELVGRIYRPEWQGVARAFADYGDFRVTWNTSWTGEQETPFIDAFGAGDTCLGADNGGVDCRDIGFVDDYFLHSTSLRYNQDTWTGIIGVSNIFDEQPSRIDTDEGFVVPGSNVVFGQDFIGRRVFVNVRKSF